MIVDVKTKAVCQIDIDCDQAFIILCKTLGMDCVFNNTGDLRVKKDSDDELVVYRVEDGQDKIVDSRGALFVALSNVAVNMFPNLDFRGADYIYDN